jgi:hypothetical protein
VRLLNPDEFDDRPSDVADDEELPNIDRVCASAQPGHDSTSNPAVAPNTQALAKGRDMGGLGGNEQVGGFYCHGLPPQGREKVSGIGFQPVILEPERLFDRQAGSLSHEKSHSLRGRHKWFSPLDKPAVAPQSWTCQSTTRLSTETSL